MFCSCGSWFFEILKFWPLSTFFKYPLEWHCCNEICIWSRTWICFHVHFTFNDVDSFGIRYGTSTIGSIALCLSIWHFIASHKFVCLLLFPMCCAWINTSRRVNLVLALHLFLSFSKFLEFLIYNFVRPYARYFDKKCQLLLAEFYFLTNSGISPC